MNLLNPIAEAWAAAMLRASIQGGIALALVLGLCMIFKRMPPRVRCVLWRLAYAKLFLSLFWTGAIALPILPPPPSPVMTQAAPGKEAPSVLAPMSEPKGSAPEQAVTVQQRPWELPSVQAALMVIWGVGTLLLLGRLVRQWQTASRQRAALRFATDAELLALYHQLCRDLALPDAPPLKVGPYVTSPMLLGIVMPTIALPENIFDNLSRREVEMVLAHELAHLRRHDLAWALLPALAQAVFFFHPLLWWTYRESRLAQEIACDELAITGTRSSGSSYSSVLVRVASGLLRHPIGQEPGISMARLAESFDDIPRRIDAMKYRITPQSRRIAISAIALATLGIVGLIPWQAAAREAIAVGTLGRQATGRYTVRLASVGTSYALRLDRLNKGNRYIFRRSQAHGSGSGSVSSEYKQAVGDKREMLAHLIVPLEIKGATPEDLMLLSGVASGTAAIDDRGNTVRAKDSSTVMSLRERAWVSNRQGHIFLEVPRPEATRLKTLEGNLLVMNGVIHSFSFPAASLRVGAEQTGGPLAVRIATVEQHEKSFKVELAYSAPAPPLETQKTSVAETMQQMPFPSQNITIQLVDTAGAIHAPNGLGSSSLRNYDGSRGTLNASFALPNGARPATLRVFIPERQGPDRQIPFTLTDIPIRNIQ